MKTLKWIIVFLMLPVGVSWGAEGRSESTKTYRDYQVIFEQNVFSKDRRPPRQNQPRRRQVRTTTVLSIYVLRGTAAEAGRAHKFAFVEEQISGETQMAKVGTTILGGTIKDIQLNYVIFEEDGESRKIKLGEEFGQTSSTVMTEASESDDTNEAGDNASSQENKTDESSGDENDLLQKLLERRRNELAS